MKYFISLLLAISCIVACGGSEPDPSTDLATNSEQSKPSASPDVETSEPGNGGSQPEAVALADPDHPHPEWASLEVDPELVVSQIEPEEYVRGIREALVHHGTKEDPIPISTDFLGGWSFDETKENPFPPHVNAIKDQYVAFRESGAQSVEYRYSNAIRS